MLLNFSAKNFKSFGEFVFSMTPAPKQKGLDYSVTAIKLEHSIKKVLCSSIIYGPNAVGKTSIISAIDLLKKIVIRGHIRDTPVFNGNYAEALLSLIPNNKRKRPDPIEFSIDFIENNQEYVYCLTIDVGPFLDNSYPRKIIEEKLSINGIEIFKRTNNTVSVEVEKNKSFFSKEILKNPSYAKAIVNESIKKDELFLCNGFKNIFGPKTYLVLFNFFNEKLQTFCNFQKTRIDPNILGKGIYSSEGITSAAKYFGSESSNLIFVKKREGERSLLCSKTSLGKVVPAEFIESLGTIRFITLFPAIIESLRKGGTLIIDEFDNSIHPMAIMSIVNIFHNDELNKKHAQLIFNSQNPIYLNNNLFRRDEIKFVDRNEDEGSTLYSLSDFGTRGTSARKNKNYMDNYFVDKYGAIRNIDFSELIEKILENG